MDTVLVIDFTQNSLREVGITVGYGRQVRRSGWVMIIDLSHSLLDRLSKSIITYIRRSVFESSVNYGGLR